MHNFILFFVSLLMFPAWGSEIFGTSGDAGQTGSKGRAGATGPSVMIRADGSEQSFDLRGEDGGRGGNAGEGTSATNCYQPLKQPKFFRGAPGGHGGPGGLGGRGGDGGAAWVQYENVSDLRNITINSSPGRGGAGGIGGRTGGRGCKCTEAAWTADGHDYTCTDGNDGYPGPTPGEGLMGKSGLLQLIPHLGKVEPEITKLTLYLEKIIEGTFSLRHHVWENRTGARLYFSPYSEISDDFLFLKETIEEKIEFGWEVPRPFSDFRYTDVFLKLVEGKVHVSTSLNLWPIVRLESPEPHTTRYTFTEAYTTAEIFNLKMKGIEGATKTARVQVEDLSKLSKKVGTQIKMTYWTSPSPNIGYSPKFSDNIPETAIDKTESLLSINLAKVPNFMIYDANKGTRVLVRLEIKRSFGDSWKTVVYEFYDVI